MTTRPNRSSSIPIPRNSASSSARNIESLISIPFVPFSRHSTSPSTSRSISDQRRVSNLDGSRAPLIASHRASTTPGRTPRLASSVPGWSASRSFEPRVIRSPATDGDSECPPNPSNSLPRRASMASVRTTSSQRLIIPQHVVARSASRPAYLDHSSLRNLLHTEIPHHYIPSRRADPTISSRNQAYANALTTPSEIEDDFPGSTVSHSALPLHEYSFKLPTRWSEQDRHPTLSVSPEGRELTLNS